MTKYREIIRLAGLNLSQTNIALSCNASKTTVNKVLKAAREQNLVWSLDPKLSDPVLGKLLFPEVKAKPATSKRMPDFEHIRKELLRNGVNKKPLWTEYLEECHLSKEEPLMYSQFCYYIQQDEQKRRATMHINRKPAEQVEVDWAGDPAHIIDPDTGEILDAQIFVGVMTYSQYPYVEAFMDQKQASWIAAHIHMYEYFGGVAKILVPDNCRTAVDHNNKSWNDPRINAVYQQMAEHYGTAIIPARVRSPKDKPNAEGSVGNISTWITAVLRSEQFFSLGELNQAIRQKLEDFSHRPFQKKEGSRYELFRNEELPLLASLPAPPYELAKWRQATVQFNYHISFAGMLYSVPHEYMARNDGTYKKIQSKYANPILLIIDEWLLLKPTESEQHDILELLHRRRKKSSTIFCSQYDCNGWYDQLGGDDSPLSEAILDRIKHDAYKINIIPTDPANYRSMREVYGLDSALSE